MGAGASSTMEVLKNDPNLEAYRLDFAELIAQEFVKYKNTEMTTEETKKQLIDALKKDDLRILMKENGTQDDNQTKTNYQNKNARKFVCCVDGTESGDITFHTMTHLMRKRDYIAILHSPDEDGKGSTFDDSSGMKHHYESQLLRRGLPSGNFLFQVEPKGNMNTLTVLKRYMSLFNSHQKQKVSHAAPTILDSSFVYEIPPDFILLGYDSWKGQNNSNTTPSSGDLVMRTFHIPCIICKKRFPDLNQQLTNNNPNAKQSTASVQPLTYIMAIDDSQTSLNGLEILLQLIKSTDRLVLVHIHYPKEAIPPQYLLQASSTTSSASTSAPVAPAPHSEHFTFTGAGAGAGAATSNGTSGSVRQGGLSQLWAGGGENREQKSPLISPTEHPATQSNPSPSPSHSQSQSQPTTRRPSRGNISITNPQTKYYPLTYEIKEQYLDILRENGPRLDRNADYDQLIVEMSAPSTDIQAVRSRLIDYVNNISPDFFVIAPKNQRKLTSFTEFILNEINTSVILCKN